MPLKTAFLIACACVCALATAPAALASTLVVAAPPTAAPGDFINTTLSGTADEPGLFTVSVVQTAACPPTYLDARAVPGVVMQNDRAIPSGAAGPYSVPSALTSMPGGATLTGPVNICSYLHRDTISGDKSTVAKGSAVVVLTAPSPPPASWTFSGRMASDGTIGASIACRGCAVKITYASRTPHSKAVTITRTLPASAGPVRIGLKLDAKTVHAVKLIRRKHRGGPVKVAVSATATPSAGAKPIASATIVRVT
jgi:hypothetical protein